MKVDMYSRLLKLTGKGYGSDKETLNILKLAAEDGVTQMIATPPHQNAHVKDGSRDIEEGIKNLNLKLRKLAIPVTVFEGMEIVPYEKIVQNLKLNLVPLAGSNKYVFISIQGKSIPIFIENTFFEMQLMGYIPVIANLERNEELVKNSEKLKKLVEKGALVHVSAACILGENGKKIRRKILRFCRGGLVHLISSASQDNETKSSLLKPAYDYLEKKISKEAVDYFSENAEKVINGSDFHVKKF